MINIDGETYRPEPEVGTLLNLKIETLRKWAVMRKGPARTKIGRSVYYSDSALAEWLRNQQTGKV